MKFLFGMMTGAVLFAISLTCLAVSKARKGGWELAMEKL
jgi:hypothetical protein